MASRAIPARRERLQSRALVWCVLTPLVFALAFVLTIALGPWSAIGLLLLKSAIVSTTFALAVWMLRAGTAGAAASGGLICLLVTYSGGLGSQGSVFRTGLLPLMALFALTFVATRFGLRRETSDESRRGRSIAQVIANLGVAGLICTGALLEKGSLWRVLLLAALCEATADTVSSEIGQAFGGTPWMVTTLRRVPVGTDGAVSLQGTAAGVLGAALVTATGMWALRLGVRAGGIAAMGGVAGLLFDSVLGATAERRGWLGNDLVNFCSTVFAVFVAGLLMAI